MNYLHFISSLITAHILMNDLQYGILKCTLLVSLHLEHVGQQGKKIMQKMQSINFPEMVPMRVKPTVPLLS